MLKKISELLLDIKSQLGFDVVMGAEVEFYATSNLNNNDELLALIRSFVEDGHINKISSVIIKKESNLNQFEAEFGPTKEIGWLAGSITQFKLDLTNWAKLSFDSIGARVSFCAQLPIYTYGNGLHIHINFLDHNQKNVFDANNDFLDHIIGGLCYSVKRYLKYMVCNKESFARFRNKDINTPKKICWGKNNRTAGIRLITLNDEVKRLEYRIPSADGDPVLIISSILASMIDGFKNKIKAPKPVYGVASDAVYCDDLESLDSINIDEGESY